MTVLKSYLIALSARHRQRWIYQQTFFGHMGWCSACPVMIHSANPLMSSFSRSQ